MYVYRATQADSASGSAGSASQVQTQALTSTATYYPTFVSANNASATAMSVYTTSSVSINPNTGIMYLGGLNVGTASGATVGQINASGEITAYYSDRRLKTNVKPIDNAVDKILKLNGITYNPNALAESFGYDRNQDIVGLFADEVEAVLPQAVKLAPFDNDNGVSKSGENYKTVQYEKLVPLLVESIKEQHTTINLLKSEILELKQEIQNLKK
jgi:hypothetical protein